MEAEGGFHKAGGIHLRDILISAKYGIYQVVGDTAGPAAIMAAFRTIPICLEICREMEKRSPNVIFINHANPMVILCRAVNKYSSLKDAIGICHGVQGGIRYVAEILEVDSWKLETVWIGTNHYYWFTEIYHRGKDVYPELKKRMALRSLETTIQNFGRALDEATRQIGGGTPESLGSLIGAIATGRRRVHIVNIPNNSAVPNLPDTAVLELEGVTDSRGVRAIHAGEAPLVLKGQLEKMIAWQELVVDAAVKGEKNLALQALMLDPMAILPDRAEAMLEELLANSKKLLPQFR